MGAVGPAGATGAAGAPGATGASGVAVPAYGIALPTTPVDKDVAILVDSLTLPTYQWTFRWNAGSVNADKWEFIGGIAGYKGIQETGTLETTASTTYVALTTPGPTFAIPRAGVYDIELGYQGGMGALFGMMSYDIGGTGALDDDCCRLQNAATSTIVGSAYRVQRKTLTVVTLTAKYKASAGGSTEAFACRIIRVTPVRVS